MGGGREGDGGGAGGGGGRVDMYCRVQTCKQNKGNSVNFFSLQD